MCSSCWSYFSLHPSRDSVNPNKIAVLACGMHVNKPNQLQIALFFKENLSEVQNLARVTPFPGLDVHKGEVAAMAQQRPFHPTLA